MIVEQNNEEMGSEEIMNEASESKKEITTQEAKPSFWKNYFNSLKLDTRSIARNAIIAAVYVALTYAFFFTSYGTPQVRISEFMVLLAFFNPNYIYGLTIGALLSNIYSPAFAVVCSPLDIVFGTLASFLAATCISLSRHMFIATIFPCIFNGLLLGLEFGVINPFPEGSWALFWVNFGWVFLGEVIAVSVLGYIVFMILSKRLKNFNKIVSATQNLKYRW
ncbi:MAG: QueT transporter family protein [Bacilli bacterium]